MSLARHSMSYDLERECWLIHKQDGRSYDIHCGDLVVIRMGRSHLFCRIELDKDWYVIADEGTRFYLRKQDTYVVDVVPF